MFRVLLVLAALTVLAFSSGSAFGKDCVCCTLEGERLCRVEPRSGLPCEEEESWRYFCGDRVSGEPSYDGPEGGVCTGFSPDRVGPHTGILIEGSDGGL